MLYALLRALSSVSLRWFYSRVDAEGLERIPPGPVLLAVNHPNAMVDALVVGLACPRRILFTGRATLFKNPLLAALLRSAGVVPLIRQKDVAELGAAGDVSRNVGAFDALTAALKRGGAVMIFPEGVTGDWTQLQPLKTGAARIALRARDAGVHDLHIVPVGLTFERKDVPRTRVFVQVGEPIPLKASSDEQGIRELTSVLEQRLRAVTLNYESADAAQRDKTLAAQLARIFQGTQAVPEVWQPYAPFADQVSIAHRIDDARERLAHATPEVRGRADALLDRLARFREELRAHHLSVEDLEIALGVREGAWFVVREAAVALFAGPVALWGWINHWIPFNLARVVALKRVESAADPAMNTILYGIALCLLAYAAQGAFVYAALGPLWGVAYLVSLPVAAEINFHLRARLARVVRRARTYLRFRGDRVLQERLTAELSALRAEALALESILNRKAAGVPA
jgi:glycerol-3-phosphate O-acyltransferase/dihydroxyacetone phosphate acyltransferase